MADKSPPAGWVVQVSTGGSPPRQFFDVAISAAEDAVTAARKRTGASAEVPIRAVRPLSTAEVKALGLKSGQVKPA
jgi:hypothetical protein